VNQILYIIDTPAKQSAITITLKSRRKSIQKIDAIIKNIPLPPFLLQEQAS